MPGRERGEQRGGKERGKGKNMSVLKKAKWGGQRERGGGQKNKERTAQAAWPSYQVGVEWRLPYSTTVWFKTITVLKSCQTERVNFSLRSGFSYTKDPFLVAMATQPCFSLLCHGDIKF